MASNRKELTALKNLLSETDLILATTKLPENRVPLLRARRRGRIRRNGGLRAIDKTLWRLRSVRHVRREVLPTKNRGGYIQDS